jgi:hypothetical protein
VNSKGFGMGAWREMRQRKAEMIDNRENRATQCEVCNENTD